MDRHPTRLLIAAVLPAALTLGCLSGCSSELRNREMTVYFKAGTTKAELASASQNCGHIVPDVRPAPAPTAAPGQSNSGLAGVSDEIRFYVTDADDHDLAQVTDCLNSQPGVLGVQPPNDDMS